MIDIAAIKAQITDDNIIALMDSMGIPLVSANSQYQLYPSACHHSDWERHKNKLYYYVQSQRWTSKLLKSCRMICVTHGSVICADGCPMPILTSQPN